MNHMTSFRLKDLQDTIFALREMAFAHTSAHRIQDLAADWIKAPGTADPAWRHATAIRLARELVLCTPSSLGVTALDRFSRAHHTETTLQTVAMGLLWRGTFRLGRLQVAGGRTAWHDLNSGSSAELLAGGDTPAVNGLHVFARLVNLEDGRLMSVGPCALLDEAGVAIARAAPNPLACAKAVFRHLVRFGPPSPEPSSRPQTNPLDMLAASWAEGADITESDRTRVRQHTNLPAVIEMLVSAQMAAEGRRSDLAAAYRRIAAIMMETMALRAANGSSQTGLDQVAAALDDAIARRIHPPQLRPLFDELRRGIAARGATSDADLDRLLARIQALRAKTVAQGCTEAEAMAAAEKVAELLDRYGLSLSELDLRGQSCEGLAVETDRRRRGPIDDCMATIALFFDCRIWAETSPAGTLRYVFFGLRADVRAALYLHDLVALAFETETDRFRRGPVYQGTHTSQRAKATNSFQLGMARGIINKLKSIRTDREAALRAGTGRDLVPVKASVVDAEMAKLGLNLRAKGGTTRRTVLTEAYQHGQAAGNRFTYAPGIETG